MLRRARIKWGGKFRMKQRIVILGSTGSIGTNTLEVVSHLTDTFEVVGLAAGSRWKELASQTRFWNPGHVALANLEGEAPLREVLDRDVNLHAGPDAMTRLVESVECDVVVVAIVGVAGLAATLRAIELGRNVAIANKEALVVAGSVIMPLAQKTGATIIPIDSEHSAVFQALQAGRPEDVERIVLTASGGPFRTWTAEQMADASPEQALAHPTWDMGPKITIDSATMMNKALEIIEARWLFDLCHEKIDVVIHPESVIHSVVEFRDGSMVAQMGTPDMRTPIQYALTYPRRLPCPSQRLCLDQLGQMTFYPPDPDRFPSLRLGHAVAQRGGSYGAVLNAANEQVNLLYRQQKLGFADIVAVTQDIVDRHQPVDQPSLEDLLEADRWARAEVTQTLA